MFHQELLNSLGIRATVRSHNRVSVTELRMILVGDLEAMREREHLKFAHLLLWLEMGVGVSG